VSKCAARSDVEDGVRVLAVVHAALGKDDSEEVDAR